MLAQLLVGIFLAISLIHVYWACGGQFGMDAAVPMRPADSQAPQGRAFNPSKIATLLVAACLAGLATLVTLRSGLVGAPHLHWALQCSLYGAGIVFLARAFGDRKYVGFSKRIRGSRFARLDTWMYSPLCAALGVGLLKIAYG